ncbi:MAG: SufD family Fe-S cluster assembly protein [Candidatus Babeliaceae bacterium]|jgi:Fe-S cluster assembly scaffold protein SufB
MVECWKFLGLSDLVKDQVLFDQDSASVIYDTSGTYTLPAENILSVTIASSVHVTLCDMDAYTSRKKITIRIKNGGSLTYCSQVTLASGDAALSLSFITVFLEDNAVYNGYVFCSGSGGVMLQSFDCHVEGLRAQGTMTVLHWLTEHARLAFTSRQMHNVSHGTSAITVKSVVEDSARMYYAGQIHVAQQAEHTVASQESKALVFNDARAHAMPSLEILTNEVQCRHGSAIGYVNQDQLLYMQSRGISAHMAEQLIKRGFLEAPLKACSLEYVKSLFFDNFYKK